LIKTANQEENDQTQLTLYKQIFEAVKFLFETLNSKTVVKEGTVKEQLTQNMLKVQRSLKAEHIGEIKKIMIFLYEKMPLMQ
jgi:hypothetical protein